MLCSNCYKKIPKGEEVTKSGKNYFRASWHSGYGTEIYCKKCAIEKDRFDRMCLIICVVVVPSLIIGLGFLTFIIIKINKS